MTDGIGLHLPEVRVHRRIEREVRRQPHLRVQPGRPCAIGAALRDGRAGTAFREDVRQELHVTRGGQAADPAQLAELVHAPGVLPRNELPLIFFLVAGNPPPRVQPPDLFVLRAIANLVQRDPELGRPAAVVVRHLTVPHGVPRRVPFVLAVPEDEVDLAAARREIELEARPLVVVAVEAHADDVHRVAVEVVAAARVAMDLAGSS